MQRILATVALTFSFVLPAHAASCNEFMSMDSAGQRAALSSMALPSDLSPASDDSTAADALVTQLMQACQANPEMEVDAALDAMS